MSCPQACAEENPSDKRAAMILYAAPQRLAFIAHGDVVEKESWPGPAGPSCVGDDFCRAPAAGGSDPCGRPCGRSWGRPWGHRGRSPRRCADRHAHGDSRGSRPEPPCGAQQGGVRSEEHTSELQSLMRISYAVFCLKKKKKN